MPIQYTYTFAGNGFVNANYSIEFGDKITQTEFKASINALSNVLVPKDAKRILPVCLFMIGIFIISACASAGALVISDQIAVGIVLFLVVGIGAGMIIAGVYYCISLRKAKTTTIQREIEVQNRKYCDRGVTWRHYVGVFDYVQISIGDDNKSFPSNTEETSLLNYA